MENQSLPTGIPPFLLVVFGGTGDLTKRKLVPAFVRLLQDGAIRDGAALVAVGRRNYTDEAFRNDLAAFLRTAGEPADLERFEACRAAIHYRTLDFLADTAGFPALEASLASLEKDLGISGAPSAGRLYYLAVAPDAFVPVVRGLHANGMLEEAAGYRRVVAEKPFGSDLASARTLQEALVGMVPEHRLYRIDHYLGKEMIRSLLGLRFANRVFEPLWNGANIDHVRISACETDGIGTRAGYYESSGALKDMLQSHLLQMLALVAMEPPNSLSPDAIRDAKVATLRTVRPWIGADGRPGFVRGQYAAGVANGRAVPAYRAEAGVAPDSDTETFVALKVRVESSRWVGVPFYLRAGKRLDRKGTRIEIAFKAPATGDRYPELAKAVPDRLVVTVQPNEGFFFEVNTLSPVRGFRTERVRMDYCQSIRYGVNTPQAYERLLADAALGSTALFVRWDELETAWAFVDALGSPALEPYPAGSCGPDTALRLLEDDGRAWDENGG